MKEFFQSVVGIIVVAVLCVALTFGGVFLLRPYLNLKRQAIQSSQQYTETKQRFLMELVIEYHSTEKEEVKKAIASKMKLEVQNVPADQIPAEVQQIIKGIR